VLVQSDQPKHKVQSRQKSQAFITYIIKINAEVPRCSLVVHAAFTYLCFVEFIVGGVFEDNVRLKPISITPIHLPVPQ